MNKIISTTITAVLYAALATGLLLFGQKIVIPMVTDSLTETLNKAANAGGK